MLNVSLVEDDDVYRELLCHHISKSHGLCLTSAYATAEEALRRFPREKPDVALIDIKLPGMDGIECVRRLRHMFPTLSTRFLMLTGHEDSLLIFKSLTAGAHGYLLKDKTSQVNLLAAVKEVAAGGGPMTPSVAREVVSYFASLAKPAICLTDKESAVLRDLTEGLRYKEIAENQSISINTVRKRVGSIYDKLHVRTRKEAVQFAHDQASAPVDKRTM